MLFLGWVNLYLTCYTSLPYSLVPQIFLMFQGNLSVLFLPFRQPSTYTLLIWMISVHSSRSLLQRSVIVQITSSVELTSNHFLLTSILRLHPVFVYISLQNGPICCIFGNFSVYWACMYIVCSSTYWTVYNRFCCLFVLHLFFF